jgi:transcriptional regulator with XRE-family HTH domain
MTEGLAAQISSIVRRHLADAHRMLGALLAQLDAGGEVDLGGSAATPELAKPAIAAPSPKPSTVGRRARLARARQRHAAGKTQQQIADELEVPQQTVSRILASTQNGGTAETSKAKLPELPKGETVTGPWPALRTEFHAAIKARGLTRRQAASKLGVAQSTVSSWVAPHSPPPGAANIRRIRAWLTKTTPSAKAPLQAPILATMTSEPPPEPEPVSDAGDIHQLEGETNWLTLRATLRGIIRDRGLTQAEVAGAVGIAPGTFAAWLAPKDGREPGPRSLIAIRQWLADGAVLPAATPAAQAYALTVEERGKLTGHLSLAGNGRELREHFGATRELLEKASLGAHLAADVVGRIRSVLATETAAAE